MDNKKIKNSNLPTKKFALSCVLASTFSTSFFAIAENEQQQQVKKISITGSAINRVDAANSLPVIVIGQKEIARSGVQSVTDLIQNLPIMQGFTHLSQSVGGLGGGVTTASLHGIGEQQTLVLLNGRRIAANWSGSIININTIPLASIERIEILTEGASALYGSDAIAGVLNFITKKDFEGINANVGFAKPQEAGGNSNTFSLTGGIGDFEDDGYNLLVSLSKDTQAQVAARDRDFASTGFIPFSQNGQDYFYLNGSSSAAPANAVVTYLDPADGENHTWMFNPYRFSNNNQCAENNLAILDYCLFDYASTVGIFPESTRDSLMVNSIYRVNDNLSLFADINYSDSSVIGRLAPYPVTNILIPQDSAIATQWITPYIADNLPDGATVNQIRGSWRAQAAGNRTTEYATKSTNIVIGTRGAVSNIDYEAALVHSINDSDENYLSGWIKDDIYYGGLTNGDIDIWALSDGMIKEQIAQHVFSGNWTNNKTTVNAFDAKATMPLFKMAEGDAYLATGLEARNTTWALTSSQANNDQILLWLGNDPGYDMKRENFGAFVEILLPLASGLDLTSLLRYDNFGAVNSAGADVNDSEGDTSWKLSLSYKPSDQLLLRGSAGTGFKAPSMLDIASPRRQGGITVNQYACPLSASDPLAEICPPGLQQYQIYNGGNPNLKNEHSRHYSVGFDYSPSKDISLTIDYWNVAISDAQTSVSEAQIFQNPELYRNLFVQGVTPTIGLPELTIILTKSNVGKQVQSGFDWNFILNKEFSFGQLTTHFNGTHILESETSFKGSNHWNSNLGEWGDNNSVTFKTRFQVGSTLGYGDFEHTLTANFQSGYTDQLQTEARCRVRVDDLAGACTDLQLSPDSHLQFNWLSQYRVNDQLKVSVGINNLTDKSPPMAFGSSGSHQVGYESRYYDVLGRTYYINADYTF